MYCLPQETLLARIAPKNERGHLFHVPEHHSVSGTNSEFQTDFRAIFFPQIRGPVDIKAGKYMALVNTFGVGENIQ